jgi:hypothetical protein
MQRSVYRPAVRNAAIATTDTSDKQVCDFFPIYRGDRLRVDVVVSASAGSGTVTLKLFTGTAKTAANATIEYSTAAKTVAVGTGVAAKTVYYRSINPEVAADQDKIPLGTLGVVRADSDGTGECTIDEVIVVQES